MAKKNTPKKKPAKKSNFAKAKSTEAMYARALRSVGREVGKVVKSFGTLDPTKLPAVKQALQKYAEAVAPWAKNVASRMIAHSDRQDARAWKRATQEMGFNIQRELRTAPTGLAAQALMKEQVTLITSIPLDAAERVHRLVLQNFETQGRAKEIAKEIQRSGEVAQSRATLIARTEVARTSSVLTQARAEHIGSDGYIWRTVKDSDVRHSHKKMDGKLVKWDSPPTLDGLTGHAGQLPNCRCYPEPVIPKELL